MLTDTEALVVLLEKNNIDFQTTILYNDNNEWCGHAIWFNQGHVEFDLNGKLTNVVTY